MNYKMRRYGFFIIWQAILKAESSSLIGYFSVGILQYENLGKGNTLLAEKRMGKEDGALA